MKKGLPSNIYDREYFQKHFLGFERMLNMLMPYIKDIKNSNVLDLGCGSGDLAIFLAGRGNKVTGVDYSTDAIKLAKRKLSKYSKNIRNKVRFIRGDANRLNFKTNEFDALISIDVFEHLYKDELINVMGIIARVVKPGGSLLVHTEANPLYLDIAHPKYIYPLSERLIKINKLFYGKDYPGLSKDPRNNLHKIQHVNEPTYFYLKKLFSNYCFKGKIFCRTLKKPVLGWKDVVYNSIVILDPFSRIPPLKYIFAYDFICVMKNHKKHSLSKSGHSGK